MNLSKLIALGIFPPALKKLAADTLSMINGTTAQAFHIYNTFTDSSNYERGIFSWVGNLLILGAEALGTGTQRRLALRASNIDFQTGATTRVTVNATNFSPTGSDNTYALGSITARYSNLFLGGYLTVGDGVTAPTATVGSAKIYVDTADGDLKIIFGDGTIKTIVVDT